jgi:hypothetical protein
MYGQSIRGIGYDSWKLNLRPIKVYDVEKKELIKTCESVIEAAKFTGLKSSMVSRYTKDKTRSYKNKLNKTICFRG